MNKATDLQKMKYFILCVGFSWHFELRSQMENVIRR